MILGYRDTRTRDFAAGKRIKAFSGVGRAAQLKLDRLDAAVSLGDLAALPGNRLEALRGDRKGQYSIRINDQWRICFEWPEGSASPVNVELVDDHQGEPDGTCGDSPRRAACRRAAGARDERRRARAPAGSADQPRDRNPERAARDHRRYGPAPRSFLRHLPRVLPQPPQPLRAAPGRAEGGQGDQGSAHAEAPKSPEVAAARTRMMQGFGRSWLNRRPVCRLPSSSGGVRRVGGQREMVHVRAARVLVALLAATLAGVVPSPVDASDDPPAADISQALARAAAAVPAIPDENSRVVLTRSEERR